jgi:hypothetical protein
MSTSTRPPGTAHRSLDVSADHPNKASSTLGFAVVTILSCAVALLLFFRDFFDSNFGLVAGDVGDNRFIIMILEHWRAVAQGRVSFTSPNFFWPEPGVLGYSESLFLLAVPYTVLRSLRLDYYLAFEITLLVLKAIGFFSMLWLLRAFVRVSRPVALIGAAVFTLSNLYYLSVGHAQLMTVVFVPLFCSVALKYWREQSLGRTVPSILWISASAVLLALIFFTSFYIGWFTVLAGGTTLLMTLLGRMLAARSLAPASEWAKTIKARRRAMAIGLALFGVAIIPFLITYLPVLSHTGGRAFSEILLYCAQPVDAINISSSNWLWGKVLAPALSGLSGRYGAGEKERGWPPLMMLVFLLATATASLRLRRLQPKSVSAHQRELFPIGALGITSMVLWLLSIKFGGYSLWWIIFNLVPGGSAIRVPVRLHFVLNVLVIIVVALALEHVARRLSSWTKYSFLFFCGVALITEQLNVAPWHQIHRHAENAILSRIKPPPADCRAFFATHPSSLDRPFYAHQIDAMFVARAINLPTINGYSGWIPPGWNFLTFDPDYFTRAEHWAMSKGITQGLCGCDLQTGNWSHIDPTQTIQYALGTIIDFRTGGNAPRYEEGGWGEPELGGTWTIGARSTLILNVDRSLQTDLLMSVEMHAFTTLQRPRFTDTVFVNSTKVAEWLITGQERMLQKQVRIPRSLISSPLTRVEFVNHDPRSPSDLGISADGRKIGLALHTMSLKPLGGP